MTRRAGHIRENERIHGVVQDRTMALRFVVVIKVEDVDEGVEGGKGRREAL